MTHPSCGRERGKANRSQDHAASEDQHGELDGRVVDLPTGSLGPVIGPVPSTPTVWRALSEVGDVQLTRMNAAVTAFGGHWWALLAARPGGFPWLRVAGRELTGITVLDLDASIVFAALEKQDATRTWKKTFGHHRLLGFADHGTGGGGEPVAELLRPGKAGSNTAVDHVAVFDQAMAQLPEPLRRRDGQGRVAVLVRTDAAGATHQFAAHLAGLGVGFSLGANLGHFNIHTALAQLPPGAWTWGIHTDFYDHGFGGCRYSERCP